MKIALLSKYNILLIEEVHNIYNSAFSDNVFRIWDIKDFIDIYNMGSKFYLLYEKNNLIAYSVFLIGKNVGEIISIGVKETFQSMGYGRHLIRNFIKTNENITKLNLEVAKSNYKAISFYHSLGFHHVDTRKNYYLVRRGLDKGKKIHALILEMNIK
tara:strand:- start:27075 stop:27545 length:471 start_codon:yes stop_codon:yes gene_type:complete